MNMVIKTIEIHNEDGDLIKLVYYYDNGTKYEREVFISSQELERMNSVKKRWLGNNS